MAKKDWKDGAIMIKKEEIDGILEGYDKKDITIATICSHTALQIFFGARLEGFKTIGICKPGIEKVYESFTLAKPDKFVTVNDYNEILDDSFQNELIEDNAIIIPHGSFVEYVGAKNIENKLFLPLFGNRRVLEWESDRKKEEEWLKSAGIRVPMVFKDPSQIDRLVIVKFPGAKGGKTYFLAKDEDEFHQGMEKSGMIGEEYMIQEYMVGTRFYPHYFHSSIKNKTELLSMDIRYESNIDGITRLLNPPDEIEPSFVITGNTPVVIRESLLPRVLEMGEQIIRSSKNLFSPGLNGPFCIETICTENLEFVAFEVSARIVAGTNLYIHGSPYSQLLYKEPMCTGRRIAREVNTAIENGLLGDVVY